jgi:uncharacterized small protein (DUF1192 family)
MSIDLTGAERDLLLELLREELGRLKAEINRTETMSFKDELKARETTLSAVIGRLEATVPSA